MGKNSASPSIDRIRPNLRRGFADEGCLYGKYQIGDLQIWQLLKRRCDLKAGFSTVTSAVLRIEPRTVKPAVVASRHLSECD